MDKNAIKKYAVWARRELIERVAKKALQYGIEEKSWLDVNADSIGGKLLSASEKKQRQALIAQINDKGYEQVMEEVAYTWFNRFSALRYMEVNGYIPTHVRVFTDESNNFKPQILAEAIHLEMDGLDMDKVFELKDANQTDELYKYLLIAQCNSLSEILPGMFQKISDYTELLLPDNLLREGSVIEQMITLIEEDDWKDAVQIIGWLYQYYNSEKKDEVFAALKKNVKITKENIPAATQLFTPDWIVRYMVENSLGRLWLEGHPNNRLKSDWKYYLDEAEQETDVRMKIDEIREGYKNIKPEDIKCIDPCSGSGHILAYMFDVLIEIYETYGYTTREAVRSIIENNIYGLDIDERAAQLAQFSIAMKARQYDRRFFAKKNDSGHLDIPLPHIYSICESNHISKECLEYFSDSNANLQKEISSLVNEMYNAKEYGSVLNISEFNFKEMLERIKEIEHEEIPNLYTIEVIRELLPLINVAQTLGQKYHIAITNPPYLSARGSMNPTLTKYLSKYYPLSKNDLFTVFMEVCNQKTHNNGFYSLVNQQSWMFLAGFAKLRESLYNTVSIENLIQIGAGAFEGIAGEVVQSVAFTIRKAHNIDFKAVYLDFTNMKWKEHIIGFNRITHRYLMSIKEIRDIPNGILCYHLGGAAIQQYYNGKRLDSFADPRVGMATGDNDIFVRLWQEVDFNKIGFNYPDGSSTIGKCHKWYPYNKGGECRRWYGNRTHLVDWYNNGQNINAFKQGRLLRGEIEKKNSECWNRDYYFMESISWSKVSSGRFAVRYYEKGFIFDVAGCSILGLGDNLYYVMGALNSELRQAYIESLSPTLNFETGAIKAFPIIINTDYKTIVENLVKECILLEKEDWDSRESSWDFKRHPLIKHTSTIEDSYILWEQECELRYKKLQSNEEALNKIFIEIYGLTEELTQKVSKDDVTVSLADLQRDIKSLISYAVGCMFGRYSMNSEGIIYAGGDWNRESYSTFKTDQDNVIPICDDEYFEDDIVGRFIKFIEVVYGKETLQENLKYISNALGGKGQPKEVIRNYFINDFFADHCSVYSVTGSGKRPIYWQFDSGKKNGFKCLIYMHRYQADTIMRIRTDYVHEQQSRYRTAIADLQQRIEVSSTSDKVKLTKQLRKIQDQEEELRGYEEKIHHLADQMISIDLDDGVINNYEIFKDVLAKIK